MLNARLAGFFPAECNAGWSSGRWSNEILCSRLANLSDLAVEILFLFLIWSSRVDLGWEDRWRWQDSAVLQQHKWLFRKGLKFFKREFTGLVFWKSEMMVLLDLWDFVEVLLEKRGPIIRQDDNASIVCSDQLCFVDSNDAWSLHHLSKLIQGKNKIYFVHSLDYPKAAIGAKLRMTGNQKGVINWIVELLYQHHLPCQSNNWLA